MIDAVGELFINSHICLYIKTMCLNLYVTKYKLKELCKKINNINHFDIKWLKMLRSCVCACIQSNHIKLPYNIY